MSVNGVVGIQLQRSYEILVAIYAVIKAGGAYLPLDPLAPTIRNKAILEDGQIEFLIVGDHAPQGNLQILNIHDDVSAFDTSNLGIPLGQQNLAYVMYTSGTTGKPKGVMISHQALVNRLQWMQNTFPLQANDIVFHKTHPCFDISIWETWWWSIAGAGVTLLPAQKEHDIKLFVRMIEQYKLSVIHFVPSVFRIFLSYIAEDFAIERLKSLRFVFSSGEALDARSVNLFNQLFQAQSTRLINLYGPTEATIDVSYFDCGKKQDYQTIPIGRAIQNIQLFVLDEEMNLMASEPGELFISGMGLAQGYLNNETLTQAAFIDNPYLPGEKMYRTGDLVRWNENEELLFLGRKDDQVKLRGIRIELGEIQYHLLQHFDIQDAVVICEKVDGLDQRLVAFLIGNNHKIKPSSAEIKSFLSAKVPVYMIPERYIWLSELPIKENGKIDKAQLGILAHQIKD